MIKEYFANYYLHTCDVTFDLAGGDMEVHRSAAEPWKVTLVDTGDKTMTGGRLKRVLPYLEGEEEFCFTYGDGLCRPGHRGAHRVSPGQWPDRHRHRRPAAGPLWGDADRWQRWSRRSRRSRAATAAG